MSRDSYQKLMAGDIDESLTCLNKLVLSPHEEIRNIAKAVLEIWKNSAPKADEQAVGGNEEKIALTEVPLETLSTKSVLVVKGVEFFDPCGIFAIRLTTTSLEVTGEGEDNLFIKYNLNDIESIHICENEEEKMSLFVVQMKESEKYKPWCKFVVMNFSSKSKQISIKLSKSDLLALELKHRYRGPVPKTLGHLFTTLMNRNVIMDQLTNGTISRLNKLRTFVYPMKLGILAVCCYMRTVFIPYSKMKSVRFTFSVQDSFDFLITTHDESYCFQTINRLYLNELKSLCAEQKLNALKK